MPLLVFLTFAPPVWVTLGIILRCSGSAQFTWLKFIHPVRTERWRRLNLPVCLLWVVLAGWSVWENFDPPRPVKLGLLADQPLAAGWSASSCRCCPSGGRSRRSEASQLVTLSIYL